MRLFDEGNRSRLVIILVVLLGVASGAYVLHSNDEESREAPGERQRAGERIAGLPKLRGVGAAPPSEEAQPLAIAHPERGEPARDAKAGTWRIDFTITNAERWQRVIFLPLDEIAEPIEQRNHDAYPHRGAVEVTGSGRLIIQALRRLPWCSEVLEPPPSGVISLTASMDEGLEVSGEVVASDDKTPISEGLVWVKAAGLPGVPFSAPIYAWTTTDALGRFFVAGLHSGEVEVHARARDKSLGLPTSQITRAGDANLHMRLEPQTQVTLRIFDTRTGGAPEAASIQVNYPIGQGARTTFSISSRVSAREEPWPMTLTGVRVGAPGVISVRAPGFGTVELPIDLPAAGGLFEFDVPLEPIAEAVLVLNLDFDGVDAPQRMDIVYHSGEHGHGETQTVVAGRIEVPIAPTMTAVTVGSILDRRSYWVPVRIPLRRADTEPGVRVERDVSMVQGGHLRFDKPPPASLLKLTRGTEVLERRLTTSRTGGYVTGLRPGTWAIRVEGKAEIWIGEVEIQAGKTTAATPVVQPR